MGSFSKDGSDGSEGSEGKEGSSDRIPQIHLEPNQGIPGVQESLSGPLAHFAGVDSRHPLSVFHV